MRLSLAILGVVTVAACAPPVPDSASGVDLIGGSSYEQQREAELAGAATATGGTELVATAEDAGPQVSTNHSGISDEQDFQAVAARESIQSDAERLEAQRQLYQVIEPTAVPGRTSTGPNIVEYALTSGNQVGQKVYRRTNLLGSSQTVRNCAKYPSADLAQEAFLKAGGPDRDRMSLDPDGDGFACGWDPRPFRKVVN